MSDAFSILRPPHRGVLTKKFSSVELTNLDNFFVFVLSDCWNSEIFIVVGDVVVAVAVDVVVVVVALSPESL